MQQQAAPPAEPLPRLRWLNLATGIGCLAALVGLLFLSTVWPQVLRYEHGTADWRTYLLSPVADAEHPRIAIVAISDETLRGYPLSPIDRGLLARIVQAVDAGGPRAIGLDVLFLRSTEDAKDTALIDVLRMAKSEVVLGVLDERGELQPYQREFQKAYLERAGRKVGYLNLRYEPDGVVRYASPPGADTSYPISFTHQLAVAGGASPSDTGQPIIWRWPPAGVASLFPIIPAHELIGPNGAAAAAKLKDRIVLIGGLFPTRDQHRTPFSVRRSVEATMPGVVIHAYTIATLLDPARAVHELTLTQVRGLLMVLAAAGFALGWRMWGSARAHLLGSGLVTGVLLCIDALIFLQFRLLLPFTLAFGAWILGVTAGRALRPVGNVVLARRREQ